MKRCEQITSADGFDKCSNPRNIGTDRSQNAVELNIHTIGNRMQIWGIVSSGEKYV
jgi:hypothetical protein